MVSVNDTSFVASFSTPVLWATSVHCLPSMLVSTVYSGTLPQFDSCPCTSRNTRRRMLYTSVNSNTTHESPWLVSHHLWLGMEYDVLR